MLYLIGGGGRGGEPGKKEKKEMKEVPYNPSISSLLPQTISSQDYFQKNLVHFYLSRALAELKAAQVRS